MTPLTIIVLAAGLGTRMKSKIAKVLHRAGGKALIEHVLDTAGELTDNGSIHVVTGHQAAEVEALIAPRGVRFVRQGEQKGTGHAVLCCQRFLQERSGRVIVLYGDVPLLSKVTLQRLLELHESSNAGAVAVTTILENPSGYGRILRSPNGEVEAVVEEKAATAEQRRIKEINAGIYCFQAELLWSNIASLQPTEPAGEYYLTDMVEILHRAGHRICALLIEDSSELLGINTRVELADADRLLRWRKVEQLMLDGVTIERPETVTVDAQVTVGPDTVIEPFARITGNTVIGADCRVGAGAIVDDSRLEDGVRILPLSIIVSSFVERGAIVGPYARLRPGTYLETEAHVGNFVELKNTRLGRKSKAQHLSYLGDATIGENVNVGAGTITCNFDGKTKSETRIGSGAFVGSHATLVAPVEIGQGSYIGAGSVITETVPADSLALGRGRQVVKPGWALKRRQQEVSK